MTLCKQLTFLSISITLILSCTGINNTKPRLSRRDSVLNLFREELALNRTLDSSEFSYDLLIAYAANDTTTLDKISREIQNERQIRIQRSQLQSCIKLVNLGDMNIDEGYRFEYDGAMCYYRQITTIYKRNDSIMLNFLLYQLQWDTAKCRELEKIDRVLTQADWDSFVEKINNGDFWGLKMDNHEKGLDGSTWDITGFKKGRGNQVPKSHFVHRWGQTSLYNAFEFATILAGNKKGCLTIRKK